ncbi:MAG TPA: acylphosphatase [Anaerohalosphaeraceae bacterium]|nr:acylphosphatase [Anaerohalosphaeraceae bacterium]HOL30644.1 acylphosphatase [Anaerohalosphaeraceae bacterium]HOM75932.1 acylphosphatase [Anaerohalosphaeraceae bacterium]HPC65058.1 acylphosphatase [Anaerohalosphaeraceae bacterium]HPO70670.1 acylphosphatase [Anaerohalosphaeraceae bacterium]
MPCLVFGLPLPAGLDTISPMEPIAVQVIFRGRVQGVGFRYTARRIASQHNLTGFVRNCPDGSVEALLQGQASAVDACIEDIQDSFSGYIRDIQRIPQPVNPRWDDFRITY